jgi:hypothetical protein
MTGSVRGRARWDLPVGRRSNIDWGCRRKATKRGETMGGIGRIWPGQGGNRAGRRGVRPVPIASGRRTTQVASSAPPQMRLAKRQGATMAMPARAQRRRAASQAAPRHTAATRSGGPMGWSRKRGTWPS